MPGLSSVDAKTFSSITTPVTFSFFVTGHRTRIRLITPRTSHIGGQKLVQSCPAAYSETAAKTLENPELAQSIGEVHQILSRENLLAAPECRLDLLRCSSLREQAPDSEQKANKKAKFIFLWLRDTDKRSQQLWISSNNTGQSSERSLH